jgi:hypothetical protein
MKKKFEIKSKIQLIFSASSIHAVPNMVKDNFLIVRLIWLVCFLTSTSFCAYFIILSIQEYFTYEVVTNIRLHNEMPFIFPMVTICNLNVFTTNFSRDILNDFDEYSNISDSLKLNQLSGRYKALVKALNANESYQKMLGSSLNETIISCVFDWHDCSLMDDFSYNYDYEYGNCFRYNGGKNMKNEPVPFKSTTTSGLSNGLQLELFTQNSKENDNPFSMYNGFNIFISNRSVHSYFTEGINVSPGLTTKIIINKYSILKKPIPYSQCSNELNSIHSYHSNLYKKVFEFKNRYRYTDCISYCTQLYIIEFCECFDSQNGKFTNDSKACNEPHELDCVDIYYDLFLKEKMITKCDCPFECEMTNYFLTTSIAEYPTKSYARIMLNDSNVVSKFGKINKEKISYEDLKSRLVSVNIFYNDLNHIVIKEEVKMSIISLISYVGGTLSLFLGMSFLSFIEFVEIFLQTLFILVNNAKLTPIEILN